MKFFNAMTSKKLQLNIFSKKVRWLGQKCFSTDCREHNMDLKVKKLACNDLHSTKKWFKMKSILLFLSPFTSFLKH